MARKQGPRGIPVNGVVQGSIAADLGIERGDWLLAINGQEPQDLIDYRYLVAGETINLHIRKTSGEEFLYEIEKNYDEDVGLEFASACFTDIKRCQNHCIFCFVDQMPRGMRPTLYIKDDDYRLSFLEGNFITLTNLKPEDFQRIIDLRLSPLYISVHTVDPDLRQRLMGNKRAGEIKEQLHRFVEAGLEFHAQVVLVPGVNDGFYLEETISTLLRYWPQARSLAVVPVGLTGHRQGLARLRTFTSKEARSVLRWGRGWQEKLRKHLGYTFLYLADEFYVLAGEPVPERGHYDDFPHLENGVGLIRLFLDELAGLTLPPVLTRILTITLVTGVSAAGVVRKLAERLETVAGLQVEVAVIKNHYFGETVTVAGLITGKDLISQLKGKPVGDVIFLPEVMLRKESEVFLDNLSLHEVSRKLGTKIVPVSGPAAVARFCFGRKVKECAKTHRSHRRTTQCG